MTLLQLKYIATVARCGSFSKAAQELYVSQPGISKMVRGIEEELGITIFVRSNSGITLTDEGQELLNMGNRLLSDADRITQYFHQNTQNTHETLNISSQHYCFVIDALSVLQNSSRTASYAFKLLIGENSDVIQQVTDKESELGVLFVGSHNEKFMNRVFEENDLEFHELAKSLPCVFLHKDHPLAQKDCVTFDDLQPYPCIMYNLNVDSPTILHEEFFITDFYPEKITIVNDLYHSLRVMSACNGYDVGCGIISKSNKEYGIIKRPFAGVDIPISIGWVRRKSTPLSPLAKEFVRQLAIFCQDR